MSYFMNDIFFLTIIIGLFIFWDKYLSEFLSKRVSRPRFLDSKIIQRFGEWIVILVVFMAIVIYLSLSITQVYNLVSLVGLGTFVLFAILISAHPSNINWRILVAGLEIQFILGVILMRTEFGYQFFKFLSGQVTTFLEYTDRGSQLVFGDQYIDHKFAFKVNLISKALKSCLSNIFKF